MFDCVVLTDRRYAAPTTIDAYIQNVLDEDGAVVSALSAAGLSVTRLAWDDPDMDWSQTRSVLFRTTWDYFERWPEFSAWLDTVRPQTRLINPDALITWNLDKRYLIALAEQGISVVPTRYIHRGDDATLSARMTAEGWSEVVVKPAISGGGRDTFRVPVPVSGADEARYRALLSAEDMLLQPFLPSILTAGEVSLIVIDGEVTHAVRKVAAEGEFRVQDDHGGRVLPHDPLPDEIAVAEAAIAACSPSPVYARVDLVRLADGTPAIMELELVEPELFFRFAPHAATRLAEAVARLLG
ncbi:MAG: glutathione synthase/RimK-type ligase-like ATP-grasp enzyme [Myxococcota bacterium]|jgi:glutathione synthase/RimK-type ligase-like ATP-grasp enzyme